MKKAQSANFPDFEQEMLAVWAKDKTFEASLKQREGAKRFSFYDGPPFANGLPHYGHVVALTEKDAVTRYKTMRGYYVPRRNGWDTHGLPVEVEVEKAMGISGKKQILELGIDTFNKAARESVFKYKGEWETTMKRLGRWADMDNDYATLDDDYIESVWWAFSELNKKGLVYKGFRSNPYCPRCATPLSNFEVNQNYKDDTIDPSVYVKFELVDHPDTAFLAWTTTPWTLSANAALAVDAKADYVKVELLDDGDSWKKGEKLILAKERLSVLELCEAEYKVLGTMKGSEMAGGAYKPLYEAKNLTTKEAKAVHHVYVDDSVSLEDGTGILHVSPRYGETDLAMGQRLGLPLLESVDGNGEMVVEPLGVFFKDADRHIIAELTQKGHIFAAEDFTHTYPFCWRCDTPLMYFAMPSWFIEVTKLRQRLVDNNKTINWVPAHIKQGRFGNWLAEARDWNVSRNRFWGAPLPIWVNEDDNEDRIFIGSLAELRELSGLTEFELHRPGIDEVIIKKDGKTYKRTEEVFDCWFESGSMPYAQQHYPFANKDQFAEGFPADFIAEGLDQTRGWFYTLHVLGTALFDKPAYQNVVVNGLVLAADGLKLSKRLRNYPEPEQIFSTVGADSLRFFFMASPVLNGEDVRFSAEAVTEVQRNVFLRLWNVYSFFSTYAEIDKWQPPKTLEAPTSANILDQWLLSRLDEVILESTKQADAYQIPRAVRPLRELVDDLSNWYVRRSRRRFSKNDDAADQASAYATLHYTLVRLSQLLAPWSPFVADKLYRGLTEGMNLPSSVHLTDWPEAGKVDQPLLDQMATARTIVTAGLAERARAGFKVRQPLSSLVYDGLELSDALLAIVGEEVNVKSVLRGEAAGEGTVVLDTTMTHELKLEGIMRDVVRQVQSVRKEAGLAVDDRIVLTLVPADLDGELMQTIQLHDDTIKAETLADELVFEGDGGDPVKIGGETLRVGVKVRDTHSQ
jgi:isoleucyl-tRNA synthetase